MTAGDDEANSPIQPAVEQSAPELLKPQPGRVVIYFPLVASRENRLASLECSPWAPRTDRHYMLTHPKFSREVEQILADARFDENPDSSEKCVRIRFAPADFTGPSYGLALALADKLARFALDQPVCHRPIYATGRVIVDGQGAIGPVEDFPAKAPERPSSAGAGPYAPGMHTRSLAKRAEGM